MKVAIIGTGNVGRAIARGLSRKGYTITLGARDPGAAAVVALADATGAAAAAPEAAADISDLIVLALPWVAAQEIGDRLGDLTGKIVIDCSNPLGMVDGTFGLTVGHQSSGGEIVQGLLPRAHVVKTLNQVGAELIEENGTLPHRPVMFMAGNDTAAKSVVTQLLSDLGFDPLDAGDITKSRLLEPFGMLWINQSIMRQKGRSWAFAAIDRP